MEKKCNRLLGYKKRRFRYKNKKIVITLYNSLVFPHLKYCIQFWSPSLANDIKSLETVQARATKLIPEIRHLSYEGRLEILGMSSLKDRLLRLDLIQTYKILHGFDSVDYKKYFTLNQNANRNNRYKLNVKAHNGSILGNFFTYRVVNFWNKLPSSIVSSKTEVIFKSRLDKGFKDIIDGI